MAARRSVGVLSCLVVVVAAAAVCGASENVNIPSVRVAPEKRRFTSSIIEEVIVNTTKAMRDKDLATLFENCYPNTLDTTVLRAEPGDSFVITGDIEAMWLRDSTYQVHSYIPYAAKDKKLRSFLEGLVLRQLRSVVIDPYANAFNDHANGAGWQEDVRKPPMQPRVFEGKYELDSLNAVIGLNYEVVKAISGDVSFLKHEVPLWITAMNMILDTMEDMSVSSASEHGDSPYTFHRMYQDGMIERYPHATMADGTGLIRSAFRPSDDMTVLDYLMPSNAQSLVALDNLPGLCDWMRTAYPLSEKAFSKIAERARNIRTKAGKAFQNAVEQHEVLPFEMDGYGHTVLMDDGNVPSLLSLPFLGMKAANYNATRKYILSSRNPFFFSGAAGKGIGSPHTGKNYIWPLALIMQAWTSESDEEIMEVLQTLKRSANNTGFMHESFHKDDVSKFTREWFAWANSFFGGLILHLAEKKPHLLF